MLCLDQSLLIVNCDDFGYDRSINQAVRLAVEQNVLSSASVLVDSPFIEEAAIISRAFPGLGIGLHINLDDLLLFDSSRYRGTTIHDHDPLINLDYCRKKSKLIENEIDRQITRATKLGFNLTHLDSHHHVHLIPGITEIVLGCAKRYSINKIRFNKSYYEEDISLVDETSQLIRSMGVISTDCFVDFSSFKTFDKFSSCNSLEMMVHLSVSQGQQGWMEQQFKKLISKKFRNILQNSGRLIATFADL